MRAPRNASAPGIEHFGESLRGSMFGHEMTREFYGYPNRSPRQRMARERLDEVLGEQAAEQLWEGTAWAYRDEAHTEHSDAYLLVQRDAAMVNFDLSMEYFASLNVDQFEIALEHVIAKGRTFKPVHHLPDWDGAPGAYVMVFDQYRQFYVGRSIDIRRRIKQHWTHRKGFDRLIFGTKYDSIFPVDELRALDTTRIYAARSRSPEAVELRAEKAADRRFCLNRMTGGEVNPLILMLTAHNPRTRTNLGGSIVLSLEDYEHARDGVESVVAQTRSSGGPGLVDTLATMDLSIYSVAREDGTRFMWSRRDSIAEAAANGELSVAQFAAFLTAIGERVSWPDD